MTPLQQALAKFSSFESDGYSVRDSKTGTAILTLNELPLPFNKAEIIGTAIAEFLNSNRGVSEQLIIK